MITSAFRRAALAALALSSLLAAAPSRALEPSLAEHARAVEPSEPVAGPPLPAQPSAEPPTDAPAPANPAPRSWLVQSSGASQASTPGEPSGTSTGLTVGAVLLLLALAALAIVMRYKRQQKSPLGPSESRLTVLSSSRVGPKAFAVTAHVNGRVLLLGVTDHTVTHLGWLDPNEAPPAAESARAEREDSERDDDDLPDDYPGSALRASRVPPAFASSSNLKRFQEVLRGAEESRVDLPLRPSYHPSPMDAASLLAAQTSDVVGGAPAKGKPAPVSIRRKRRARESLAPREAQPAAAAAQKPADPSLEGQVAGLRALRNGG